MVETIAKPNGIHQQLIDGILQDYPSAQTRGFMQALRALPDAEYMACMYESERGWWRFVSFIPDAFLVDSEKREVVVFEAVHRNDLDQGKFAKLAELAWGLDEDHYTLVLMRCDRFGRTRYLPQHASLAHCLQNTGRDQARDIIYVDDWQRYTAEHCEQTLPAVPGIYTPCHPDKGDR